MSTKRWSDTDFTQAVKLSRSVRQVLGLLGLNQTGSNYQTVWKYVRLLSLDTSHWTGKGSNKGLSHIGGARKLEPAEVLVLDRYSGLKTHPDRVRRAMLESGVPESCAVCSLPPVWNGSFLRLTIDHRDGNSLDNRPDNVRFLCPNCHSQTSTFGALNIGKAGYRRPEHFSG